MLLSLKGEERKDSDSQEQWSVQAGLMEVLAVLLETNDEVGHSGENTMEMQVISGDFMAGRCFVCRNFKPT